MKSVLVDFYKLNLRPDLGINNLPNEKERQQIMKFFETHAPNVVRKLTDQRKQQIRDFESRFESIRYNPEESLQALLDNKVLYIDSRETLDGYEARHGISWFDSTDFHEFIERYHYIKDLIDSYIRGDWKVLKDEDFGDPYYAYHMRPYVEEWIDKGYITISEWKISNVKDRSYNMYTPDRDMKIIIEQYKAEIDKIQELELPKELRPRGSDFRSSQIYFGELFPSICDEAILVLEEKLPIQRCGRNACNNILLKSGKRKYCSDECSYEAKLERDRKKEGEKRNTEINRKILCDLIELWIKLSRNDEWLKEVEEHTGLSILVLKRDLKVKKIKDGISARDLKTAFENMLDRIREAPELLKKHFPDEYDECEIYDHNDLNIPFLGGSDVSASSIGQLLKEVKGMLENEYRIGVEVEKETKSGKKKKWAIYQFREVESNLK